MGLYYDCKQSRLRFNKETLYVKGKTDNFQLNAESRSFCILYQLYHFIKNVKHDKMAQFVMPKCRKSGIIYYAKMSKITLLLWKDFCQNFTLAEGL